MKHSTNSQTTLTSSEWISTLLFEYLGWPVQKASLIFFSIHAFHSISWSQAFLSLSFGPQHSLLPRASPILSGRVISSKQGFIRSRCNHCRWASIFYHSNWNPRSISLCRPLESSHSCSWFRSRWRCWSWKSYTPSSVSPSTWPPKWDRNLMRVYFFLCIRGCYFSCTRAGYICEAIL